MLEYTQANTKTHQQPASLSTVALLHGMHSLQVPPRPHAHDGHALNLPHLIVQEAGHCGRPNLHACSGSAQQHTARQRCAQCSSIQSVSVAHSAAAHRGFSMTQRCGCTHEVSTTGVLQHTEGQRCAQCSSAQSVQHDTKVWPHT